MDYLLKGVLLLLLFIVGGVSQPLIEVDKQSRDNCHNKANLKKTNKCNSYNPPLIFVNSYDVVSNKGSSPNPYIKESKESRETRNSIAPPNKRVSKKSSSKVKRDKKPNFNSIKMCQEALPSYEKQKRRVCYLAEYKYPIDEKWFIVKKPILPSLLWYRVKRGDSFIALAKRYSTTVFDIKRWNKLDREHILKIGERLKIYPNKKTPYDLIKVEELRAKCGFYEVKSGDTILGIAKDFNVSAKEIIRLNWLKSREHILVGQLLNLPITQEEIDSILIQKQWQIEQEEKRKKEEEARAKRLKELKKRKFKYSNINHFKHRVHVIATAYTSHKEQTDESPFIAAWNNQLRPGMKIIAVSRDLIRKYGLTNGTKVHISGLSGVYTVRDKMNIRLRRHIDIYMGRDKKRALRWGRRRVIIYW